MRGLFSGVAVCWSGFRRKVTVFRSSVAGRSWRRMVVSRAVDVRTFCLDLRGESTAWGSGCLELGGEERLEE